MRLVAAATAELAGVGTSEVEQHGRSSVAAKVTPGSGTGAGQRPRPALSVCVPGFATDLSSDSDNSGPFSRPVSCLLGEIEGLYLMALKALSS